jgi:hypothetical protein
MTNKIDLSQLVGQKVVCKFKEERDFMGEVKLISNKQFPYCICNYHFNANGEGYTHQDIKSVSLLTETPPLTGIAQKHPNLNLNDFTDGDTVYVKWKSGREEIVETTALLNSNYYLVEEIYGPGAYHVVTKEIPDEPTDPAVEKAKEAVKNLTEEQIAKLIHSLKK